MIHLSMRHTLRLIRSRCINTLSSADSSIRQFLSTSKALRWKTPKSESVYGHAGRRERAPPERCVCKSAIPRMPGSMFVHLLKVLSRFMNTMARTSQLGAVDPLADGEKAPTKDPKGTRIGKYNSARDRVDADTTSRMR